MVNNKSKLTVIYILSTLYSGSTLLGMMLGSHSKIMDLGELASVHTTMCGACKEECPIWTESFRSSLPLGPGIHRRVAEKVGYEYLIDSSKTVEWALKSREEGEDVRYLHIWLIKAPERLAASYKARSERYRKSPEEAARIWARVNREIWGFCLTSWEEHRIPHYSLRYEDLVASPQGELARILNLVGLQYEEGQELYWEFEHHPIGSNAGAISMLKPWGRITPDGELNERLYREHHRELFLDEKWREVLTPEEIKAIWANPDVQEVAKLVGYKPLI